MKLRDLNARFTRMEQRAVDPTRFVDGVLSPSGVQDVYIPVDSLTEAMGIVFDCPLCTANNPAWGVHKVMIGFADRCPAGTYSQGNGGDTRWSVSGTGLDDLVLSPSILLGGSCTWHGFVGMAGVAPGEAQ